MKTHFTWQHIVAALGIIGIGAAFAFADAGATAQPAARTVQLISADIDYALDEQDLTRRAELILVGTPTGKIDERSTTADGTLATYQQTVQVHEVLKGEAVASTIRVLRAGVSSSMRQRNDIKVEGLAGPLAPGKQVLFLQPSADSGVWQIVGHTSGQLAVQANGRVQASRPEAKGFDNLSVPEVRQKIQTLAAGQ